MRDNQIIENTLWDFFVQIKSIILREQYWLWRNGYLGFDNGNSQALFLDGIANDIMVDNGKIWFLIVYFQCIRKYKDYTFGYDDLAA